MGDEFSVFGRLTQLNPSGKTRDSKEVPVDKDGRRKPKRGKRKRAELDSREDSELEEMEENNSGGKPSGKVVDIII